MLPGSHSAQTVLRRRSGRRVATSTLLQNSNIPSIRPPPPSVQPQATSDQHDPRISNSAITRAESPEQLSYPASSDADFDIGNDYFRTSSPDPEPVVCHPQKRIRVSGYSPSAALNLILTLSDLSIRYLAHQTRLGFDTFICPGWTRWL